ncbi:MAG TPA: EpsI family protein [Chthoniobacterales bacterium]
MNPAAAEEPRPFVFPWIPVLGFCALALATLVLCQFDYRHQTVPEAGVTLNLPERLGDYRGKDVDISEGERVILPKDTEFAKKAYTDIGGDVINCQIVLSGGDKRSIHRPEICLPGQGWNVSSTATMPIKLPSGKTLEVTKLRLTRPVEISPGVRKPLTMWFLYWFVGDHYTTHDHLRRILRTNLDMLLHNRAHRWAYVIISAPVLEGFKFEGKNEALTLGMLESFIPEIVPAFQKSEMAGLAESNPPR